MRKPATTPPAADAAPPAVPAPEHPHSGGSYIRQADGSLVPELPENKRPRPGDDRKE